MLKVVLSFALIVSQLLAFSQKKDAVLLTIDGKEVTKSEFESIYKKNNQDAKTDQASLDEYLELFINFKLKVKEAEALGYDTIPKLKRELEGYRKQLSAPYLEDKSKREFLKKEAYDRMGLEVRASHLLIKCDENASPEDTLAAFKRIMELRNKIINDKGAFSIIAKNKGGSEDPSVKQNGGDLGYFSAFQMVYPFESAAFNTPKGEISMPVRTKFGYHLIYVTDKREAQGEMEAAHIMITVKDNFNAEDKRSAEQKINEIYTRLTKGEDFSVLAKNYSDDRNSATKGGVLPVFGTGTMIDKFEEEAFALKNDGDMSKPFLTEYGWHIVKRKRVFKRGTFEESEKLIETKLKRDSRSRLSEEAFINKLKTEYNFKVNNSLLENIFPVLDSSFFFDENWKSTFKKNTKTFISYADTKISIGNFAEYVSANYTAQTIPTDVIAFIIDQAKSFGNAKIMDYEKQQLEVKYPEFKNLMREYHDGILLFELTDKKVWSKAVQDTNGLKAYFEANNGNFTWPMRYIATIYSAATMELAEQAKTMLEQNVSVQEIVNTINKSSKLNLEVDSGKFSVEDRPILGEIPVLISISDIVERNEQFVFVNIIEEIPSSEKTLKECRGLVTSAYQKQLEDEWIAELRNKYSVSVDKKVLYSIK